MQKDKTIPLMNTYNNDRKALFGSSQSRSRDLDINEPPLKYSEFNVQDSTLRTLDETQHVANETCRKLSEQTEQIQSISKRLDRSSNLLDVADSDSRYIEKRKNRVFFLPVFDFE